MIIYFFLSGAISCTQKGERIKITIYSLDWYFTTKENNVQFLKLSTDHGDLKMFPCNMDSIASMKLDSVDKNERLLGFIHQYELNIASNQEVTKVYTFWFEPGSYAADSVHVIADIVRY